jgi:hypothetical protein
MRTKCSCRVGSAKLPLPLSPLAATPVTTKSISDNAHCTSVIAAVACHAFPALFRHPLQPLFRAALDVAISTNAASTGCGRAIITADAGHQRPHLARSLMILCPILILGLLRNWRLLRSAIFEEITDYHCRETWYIILPWLRATAYL